jgi:outer membrane protein TolC
VSDRSDTSLRPPSESPTLSPVTGSAGLWTVAGSITQPIFQGGRLKANVRYAEAQHEQMLLAYQQTIQGAFKDVSNALIGYRKFREYRIQQEQVPGTFGMSVVTPD